MAEQQRDAHVAAWSATVNAHAAEELRRQLHATMRAEGPAKAFAIAHGAAAGVAQFLSQTLGPAATAEAFRAYAAVAEGYARAEAPIMLATMVPASEALQ